MSGNTGNLARKRYHQCSSEVNGHGGFITNQAYKERRGKKKKKEEEEKKKEGVVIYLTSIVLCITAHLYSI